MSAEPSSLPEGAHHHNMAPAFSARFVVRALLVIGAGAVVAISAFGLSAHGTAEPERAPTILPVDVLAAEHVASYKLRRSFTGSVRAQRSTKLSFERLGTIERVLVDEGDRVAAGELLVELDTRRLAIRRKQTQSQRDEAAARLAELIAGPREETIDAAAAEVRSLEAQLALEEANLRRREELLDASVIPQEEFDITAFGLQAANARLRAAQRRLDELQAGTRKEQLDAQRATVAQLDAALADIDIELEDSRLLAPFDGTVAARLVDEGAVIAPGTPLLRLVESDALEAWIGVPAALAVRFNADESHPLEVEGNEVVAQVDAVLPELDGATRTRTVVFRIGNAPWAIVPEQIARVDLEQEVAASGFWLPTTALAAGPRGLWNCYVVVDGLVERRLVEVLYTEGDRVFVRGTLSHGDHVIVSGTHRVVPDQQVRPQLVSAD